MPILVIKMASFQLQRGIPDGSITSVPVPCPSSNIPPSGVRLDHDLQPPVLFPPTPPSLLLLFCCQWQGEDVFPRTEAVLRLSLMLVSARVAVAGEAVQPGGCSSLLSHVDGLTLHLQIPSCSSRNAHSPAGTYLRPDTAGLVSPAVVHLS